MEFEASKDYSSFIKNHKDENIFIDSSDVSAMLRNLYLHDLHSHFIVTPDGTYEDSRSMNGGIIPGRIEALEEAHLSGSTIVIKDLENWNEAIKNKCIELGGLANVHLYLTPANGSGFDWHSDDRDVYIHGQIGKKSFLVKEPDGDISSYLIEKGDILFIPYGAKHKALATETASVHLSFGVWPKSMTIKSSFDVFEVPFNLNI